LTVIAPVFPLGELACSLTMTLIPPGAEIAMFGLTVTTGCPATTRPTSSEFPVAAAWPPEHVTLELDFTRSAAIRPPSRLTSAADD
jgi:hypothetical protein